MERLHTRDNLAMPEAFTQRNQHLDSEKVSSLAAAQRLGLTVMGSAAILQGQRARRWPPELSEILSRLQTVAQRAIQFARSTPGLTTALTGMKQVAHVEENLATARVAPVGEAQFLKLFQVEPADRIGDVHGDSAGQARRGA